MPYASCKLTDKCSDLSLKVVKYRAFVSANLDFYSRLEVGFQCDSRAQERKGCMEISADAALFSGPQQRRKTDKNDKKGPVQWESAPFPTPSCSKTIG